MTKEQPKTEEPKNVSRDELREFAFSSAVTAPATADVVHKAGGKTYRFTVRSPSEAVQAMAVSRGEVDATKGTIKRLDKMKAFLIIHCTLVPGTTDKAFEMGDEGAIMNAPTGGLFTKLHEAITELRSADDDEGKDGPGILGEDS